MAIGLVIVAVSCALGISGFQLPNFGSVSLGGPRNVASALAGAPGQALGAVPGVVNKVPGGVRDLGESVGKLNPVPTGTFPPIATFNVSFNGFGTDEDFSEEALIKAVESYVPDVGLISSDPTLIRFLLFSKRFGPGAPEILELGDAGSIENSQFDPSKPTKILVHGFQQNYNSSYPQNVKNAYFSANPDAYNIIVVDWGLLAIPNAPYIAPVFYPFAVNNVWKTGERLGEFITWMTSQSFMDPNSVHIIGFSLGSHVSGKAGAALQEKLSKSVARITALDPAGPEFYTGIFARKITPNDAQFVDAIHTNAGQLGIWQNVGQVDFYLNGGTGPQPGCIAFQSINKAFRSVSGTISGTCSHRAATKFYARSILLGVSRSGEFSGCTCDSLTKYKLGACGCNNQVTFGEYSEPGTTGTHYIQYKPNLADRR